MNQSPYNQRMLPHNTQAEKSVLGAMLLNNKSIQTVTDILEEADFFKSSHQIIYRESLSLFKEEGVLDQIGLVNHLKGIDLLKTCGGASIISALTDDIPSTAHVKNYARLVKDDSILRRIIQLADKLMIDAYEPHMELGKLLKEVQADIMELSKSLFKTDGFVHLSPVLDEAFQKVDELHKNPDAIQGVPSGFTVLDELISGFHKSDLIIIAARPSMGKTAFALSTAANMTQKYGKSVAVFSLEMSQEQLAMRILCSQAKVDANLVRKGKLPHQLWPRLISTVSQFTEANLYLNDTANMNIFELMGRAKSLQQLKELDVIIVDYLQLLTGGKKHENRQQEISQISRQLKVLAKDLNIPIIALSQLSRAVETRGGDGRPVLSDLRESGSIEQDADVVMFIYRPEKYGILDDNGNTQEGIAELIIAKHRNGPTGVAKVGFIDRFASFENLSYREI
jgi:replicative DNA helicase